MQTIDPSEFGSWLSERRGHIVRAVKDIPPDIDHVELGWMDETTGDVVYIRSLSDDARDADNG